MEELVGEFFFKGLEYGIGCLMWLVWRERNSHTSEDIERPVDLLKSLLAGTLFEWSRIWGLPCLISYYLLALLFDLFVLISCAVGLLL